jgi:glycosyltransferase involved in cell wall biosynthesis
MKILLVNTRHHYGGGDSTYTFSLANLLRDRGNDVSFFAMQDKRNLPDPNEDLFVSPIDFREINQVKNLANGIKVLGRVIYSQEARRKFSSMLDRVKPDIVHLQNIHAHITPSIIFEAKQRNLPVVWTLHDYKLICPNSHFLIDVSGKICEACINGVFLNAMLKRCKKDSFLASTMAATEAYAHQLMGVRKKVDAYLSPSTFLMQKLSEGGVRERIYHLPLFVSGEFFHRSDQDENYILFFGKNCGENQRN